MTETPTATIVKNTQKKRSLSWITPAVALVIALVLFVRWQLQKGPVVNISFENASGLTVDSPIMYRGAIVGRVEQLGLTADNKNVVVTARLHASASSLAVEDSSWWIVHPEMTLDGFSGLDTIIGPRYVQVAPGKGEPAFTFEGSLLPQTRDGKTFTITADSGEGIAVGAPVYYRGIQIGKITTINLSSNASKVRLGFIIEKQYVPIIRKNTKFWNVSGVNFEASITGFKLHAGPIASLIKGGITLATPSNFGDLAEVGHDFTLRKFDKDWLDWSPKIPLPDMGNTAK